MITNNEIKLIKSLAQKKFRKLHGLFVAEGEKVVSEMLDDGCFAPYKLYSSDETLLPKLEHDYIFSIITSKELERITHLKTPNKILGVFKIPDKQFTPSSFKNRLSLALDGINDPGNLGTIIRIANWYGIKNIICSESTVDVYNPKVIQSSMGSVSRVSVFYLELSTSITDLKKLGLQTYGAVMDGENIYESTLSSNGIIVIGSESHGISKEIINLIDHKISIPCFDSSKRIDSLNASIATAIICSEFRRIK